MKNYLRLLCSILLGPGCAFAQADIHFSQFYENTMLRNPAMVGVSETNYKFLAYYRSQWSSVANPYETLLVTGEYRISLGESSDYLSVGLLGYNDKAGDIDQKISAVYPAVNFNKSLSEDNNSYLSFGFIGGYVQYSFDPTRATFNNQFVGGAFNPANATGETLPVPKFVTYDVGAGINYNLTPSSRDNATYMIGFSAFHFTEPVLSYYTHNQVSENIRWNGNGAMVRDVGDSYILQLHANFEQQGTYSEFIAGALLGWKSFSTRNDPAFEIFVGSMFRFSDAFIPVVKMKYKNLSVGVSYDVNVSTLQPASDMQGGFEITLAITGDYPKNPAGYGKTVCPRF